MTGAARAGLTRYGAEMTRLRDGERLKFRGFLQQADPAAERDTPTNLGECDPGRWQLLAPEELLPGDEIVFCGRRFRAEECRPVRVGAELSHWEAVLRREAES